MTITIKNYAVEIESPEKGIIRVRIGGKPDFVHVSPIGINQPDSLFPLANTEDANQYHFSAGNVKLSINKNDGRFFWKNTKDEILLSQDFPELKETTIIKYKDGGGKVSTVKTVDGERTSADNLIPYEDRKALSAKLFFDFQNDEKIHGLGQAEEGIYDYKGKKQYLYQHNMRIPIPFMLSNKKWGMLIDCGCLMEFNGNESTPNLFLDAIDTLDFYFIHADTFDKIISGMRKLSGRASLLPKWAFGYIQSKEAYHTQEELIATAAEYRKRKIPLDCIVQDWNTWEKGKWGNKRLDKGRYPNIAEANKKLHEMHVHSMISIWPNMPSGDDHDEMADAGKLLLENAVYNAFDKDARKLYWKQAERELFSGGFDSWWCDSTEPFTSPDWCGPKLRSAEERFRIVGDEHKKYLDAALANCFALCHAKGIYQNQRKSNKDKRVFNLTRSGWAGSQQFGAVLWSGDISARWDVMKNQIPEGLNIAMSGLPWWTFDIGGFFVLKENWQARGCGMNENPNPLWFWNGEFEEGIKDSGYKELYVRWLQLGCFLPIFRSHGTDVPREIWRFGEKGEIYYDSIEAFIRLRYRIMPYIYSLAGMVHFEDYTMMRSLLFDFAEDEKAGDISDEFMFGPSFLVCPVLSPMRFGPGNVALNKKEERLCYLPGNEKITWYDFWTNEAHKGGTEVMVSAPLDKMPLFVKAGSIIPMETIAAEYADESSKALEIRVYPGADGEFTLYEDSGDGYGYENGTCNRIKLAWNDAEKIFSFGNAEHDFAQSIKNRLCVIFVGEKSQAVRYAGTSIEIKF